MNISIGADHGGVELKHAIINHLTAAGHTVTNRGTNSTDSVDYSDFAPAVCQDVRLQKADLGVLV